MYIEIDQKEVESGIQKARRMVLYYDYIFKGGWPPRIMIWAYHRMGRTLNKSYTGNDVMDYYLKLANKKEYFALLEEFKMKKTSYEQTL